MLWCRGVGGGGEDGGGDEGLKSNGTAAEAKMLWSAGGGTHRE